MPPEAHWEEAHRDVPDLAVGGDVCDGGLVPGILRELIVDVGFVHQQVVAVGEEQAA